MGIRLNCPQCGKQLNLKSFLAGKRGVCPACQAKFDIPGDAVAGVGAAGEQVVKIRTKDDAADGGSKLHRRSRRDKNDKKKKHLSNSAAPAASAKPAPTTSNVAIPAAAAAVPVSTSIPEPIASPVVPANPVLANAPTLPMGAPHQPALGAPAAMGSVAAMPAGAALVAPRDPVAEAPAASWYVRPPSGGQFCPAVGDIMRQWLQERRVTPDSLVWREGWADWQRADIVLAMYFAGQPQPAAMLHPMGGYPHPGMMAAGMMAPSAMPGGMQAQHPGMHPAAMQPLGVHQAGMQHPAMMAGAMPGAMMAMPGEMAAVQEVPGIPEMPLSVVPPRRGNYKRKSTNGHVVAIAFLVIAVLILAPLLGYVLMK